MPASLPRSSQLRIGLLLRPHWKSLTLALVAVLGNAVADLLQPWPLKIVVDNLLQSKKLPVWLDATVAGLFAGNKDATLYFAVAMVALIAIVGAVSGYAEKFLTTKVGQWIAHDLRRTLYQHIQRLSLAEHAETRKGDLLTRMTSDISAIQEFVTSALLGSVVNLLTLTGMTAVMFYMNWRLTLVALSTAPILFLIAFVFSRRIKKASRAVRKKESDLVSGVADVLSSIHVVQAFAREDYENRRFASESRDNVEAGLQARSTKATLSPVVEVTVAVGTGLVLWYGAKLSLGGELSAGVLIVFLSYLGKMYKPMRELSKLGETFSKAAVGYERVEEVLQTESRVRDAPDAREAPALKGRIEFDRVSFSYGPGAPVLKDVSLCIEPGQVAAIVGPSGTGKTTIANLIARFYDPTAGQVRIDGQDVRQYTLKSLRDQISFVLQDTVLFRATVWENIAYGKPDAEPEDTVRAAILANAHDFIVEMPQSYATMVGERGATLSGGQRQRIAIARAIVRNTPILVLDEATTGLDAASEQAVIEALDNLMKGRTSVIIAHHLGTIRHADIIFVVSDSEVVERGTHETLLAQGGVYAELCRIQSLEATSP
jgi:ATP-binding cassette, subfamily B, bacterial